MGGNPSSSWWEMQALWVGCSSETLLQDLARRGNVGMDHGLCQKQVKAGARGPGRRAPLTTNDHQLDLTSHLLNSCADTAREAPWPVAFLLLPAPSAGHRERALLMDDHNWVPGGSHVPSLGCPAPPDTPGIVVSKLARGVLQIKWFVAYKALLAKEKKGIPWWSNT